MCIDKEALLYRVALHENTDVPSGVDAPVKTRTKCEEIRDGENILRIYASAENIPLRWMQIPCCANHRARHREGSDRKRADFLC